MIDPTEEQRRKDIDPWLERVGRLTDEWHRRTCVWLAVANGGGMLAIAQRQIATVEAAAWLLLSGWLFFFGLAFSGLASWLLYVHFLFASTHIAQLRINKEHTWAEAGKVPKTMRRANGALLLSAGSLLLAVMIPLVGLSALALGFRFSWS